MSSEHLTGEYGLLENDLVAAEVKDVVGKLESLRSRLGCIEGTDGFVSILVVDGVSLNIDKSGLELKLDVELRSSIVRPGGELGPDPEAVIEKLAHIVQIAPALLEMGYERKSWGVDETAYVVLFHKPLDTSDLEQVHTEVGTMIDCFADKD